MAIEFTEENIILYPTSYARRGLSDDFHIGVLVSSPDLLIEPEGRIVYKNVRGLFGRGAPITSIREWFFEQTGLILLGKEPDYVQAVVTRRSSDGTWLYRITREGAYRPGSQTLFPELRTDIIYG